MTRYFYVYIGEKAEQNLEIGRGHRIWGWKNPWYGDLAKEAAQLLKDPGPDSYLVLAQVAKPESVGRPWPRTKKGDLEPWKHAVFQSLTIGRIAGPLYESTSPVWPDAIYPHRVDLANLIVETDVPATDLDGDALLMVRESAMRRGNAIVGPAPLKPSAEDSVEKDEDLVPDRLLTGLDGLSGQALALIRREQSKLRKAKLKGAKTAGCSLCGRWLPAGLLRLAHIKRRAVCTPDECLELANTMLACTIGCDELFERGYIGARAGTIVAQAPIGDWTQDLDEIINPLAGSALAEYESSQEPFFKWHHLDHALPVP
ncbi:hypothetical protein [Actinomycetospora callitridis]|uniref:hypothetical protein n=1 Tax=Actinomycetospora callitridis TaxID=913944 RepID=UPI002366DF20|nr:hypothetical protein [Actinomycetospora callitridis]MDD7920977.1 hypothetical protein [Actinomycetospora callitridis]